MFKKFFNFFLSDIAIDLGTANSKVYVRNRGIILQEPSVVAINQKTGQILAVGEDAKKMVGRTPAHIVAVRPLKSGVVSDFDATEQMLKYFIAKVRGKKFFSFGPRVVIGIPYGITEVEKKAVLDAGKSAGAREVFLIEEPMAAAIGAHLPIQEPGGNFIVDIGGGTTDIAVISLGGIVVAHTLKVAGDKMNEDIIHYFQEKYNLLIGERTAEALKIMIGSAYPFKEKEKKALPAKGRNLVTGLPDEIMISSEEIRTAIEKSVRKIIEEIKGVIELTPPELISDIMTRGIYIAGGGALLKGIDILIRKETKFSVNVVDDSMTAVVRGAGVVLENLDELREVLVEKSQVELPKI